MNGSSFVLVAHKFHSTPEDDLVLWLNAQGATNVLHVCHSFSDAPDRRSFFRWYREAVVVNASSSKDYRLLPEPLLYLKELVFTFWWVTRSKVTWDVYIGLDGLTSAFGLLLRLFGRVERVMFWNLDLVPERRFVQPWKDRVYHSINRFSALRVDEMWDHTELMVHEKERIFGLRRESYRGHRIVPLGSWTNRIHRYRYEECDRHTVVFMGHLLEKQGVQLILEALPQVLAVIPDARFKVIGSGAFEASLRQLAAELGVASQVDFLGRVESDEDLEREVARAAVAVAPYIRHLDTFTQFGADPGKIKIYLGAGVPILTTDVPWIASQIEARGCGVIINEDIDDIARQVLRLIVDGEANQRCRERAAEYALEFDYDQIFSRLEL